MPSVRRDLFRRYDISFVDDLVDIMVEGCVYQALLRVGRSLLHFTANVAMLLAASLF